MTHPALNDIQNAIRSIPDFPKPGINFKDITPVPNTSDLLRMLFEERKKTHKFRVMVRDLLRQTANKDVQRKYSKDLDVYSSDRELD